MPDKSKKTESRSPDQEQREVFLPPEFDRVQPGRLDVRMPRRGLRDLDKPSPLEDIEEPGSQSVSPESVPAESLFLQPGFQRLELWFIPLAVGLWLLLMCPMLGRVPRAFVDDSWSQAMAAYTLAFEGVPRNPGHILMGGVDEYLLEPRLFPSVVGAVVYRVLGFSLETGRLTAVAFSGLFLVAVYLTMRRLFNVTAAMGICLMTLIDPWVFIAARTFRAEIFVAALIWWSWFLLLKAHDSHSKKLAFLGGISIGLACWTHPSGVSMTITAFLAMVIVTRLRILRGKWLLAVVAGAGVGALPYAAYVGYVHHFTDVRLWEQIHDRLGAHERPITAFWHSEVQRWSVYLRLPERLPYLLLLLAGCAKVLFRRSRSDWLLLLILVPASPMMALVNTRQTGRYLMVLAPIMAALIWRLLPATPSLADKDRWRSILFVASGARRAAVAYSLLLVYAIMTLAPIFFVFWGYRHADYQTWMSQISEDIPSGAKTMAHTFFWTGLCDCEFLTSIIPRDWSEEQAVEYITKHQPEYVVQCSHDCLGLGGVSARARNLHRSAFGRACEHVASEIPAEPLLETYHRDFGSARVLHFHWPEAGKRSASKNPS